MSNEPEFYDQLIERMKEEGLNDERIFSNIKNLKQPVSEWEKMPRNKAETQEFYDSKIFPLTKDVFLANPKNRLNEQYDYLISTLGESPHPLILSILAINPKEKVFLLHTRETEKFINYIVEESGLCHTKCKTIPINGSDVAELYRKMKELYPELEGKKIAIDITGGKKTMSCGASLAGFMMGAEIFYVDNYGYDSNLRRPKPGAEFLYKVKNPLEIFGDIELRSAIRLFNDYSYARAIDILKDLEEKVPDDRTIKLIRLLAETYDYWDELKFKDALKSMDELINLIQRYESGGLKFEFQSYIERLEKQRRMLNNLCSMIEKTEKNKVTEEILINTEMVKALIFFLYTNAERRQHQGKFDTSALMMYRILELIMQRKLMKDYNINPDYPNYDNLIIPKETILEEFNKEKGKIHKYKYNNLPSPIGLLDGYTLLKVLKDRVFCDIERLENIISERNKSILAHGFKPIEERNFENMKKLTGYMIKLFCEVEGINFESERQHFKFLQLPEDENLYSFFR